MALGPTLELLAGADFPQANVAGSGWLAASGSQQLPVRIESNDVYAIDERCGRFVSTDGAVQHPARGSMRRERCVLRGDETPIGLRGERHSCGSSPRHGVIDRRAGSDRPNTQAPILE